MWPALFFIITQYTGQTPLKNQSQYQIAYAEALNAPQLQAVMFDDGPLLVIAGAGSGKTRTLTYRVARLVEDGVSPAAILLLTFTRKASSEMLSRASRLLDNRCDKVSGGTFHSYANSVLRRYAAAIGFSTGYSILDRADTVSLIGMAKKELGLTSKKHAFPRNQTLANIFSKAINKAKSIEDLVYDDFPHFFSNLDAIRALFEAYKQRKVQHNFLDYDDLLVFLFRLLKEQPQIRDKISSAYRYIMVDEYQDTNHLQAEILYQLASRNNNVMAVGDDSQSIYAFRGANFKNIMDFPRIFTGTTIIGLEENYRSVQPILTLTNAIIARAAEKYEKKLFTRKTGNTPPLLVDTGNENNQSQFITARLKEIAREGVPLNQIAVLFRASFHSFDLEIELTREQIPFIKVGGFKFMESAHIKDVLAHLKVIVNPHDRLSWFRLLLLLDKVGPKTAHDLYEAIANERAGYAGIFTIDKKNKKHAGLTRLSELFAKIDSGPPLSVVEMGAAVLNYYQPILGSKYDDHPKRIKDLEQLLIIMERYRSLDSFLIDMALEPPGSSIGDTLSAGEHQNDRLVLSTIHSAKGLEWHTVFIIWALDGRFPSIHALDDPDDLEEELRLMYVAATRAKEKLFITYPSQVFERGIGLVYGSPSRFIDMLPDDVLEKYRVEAW